MRPRVFPAEDLEVVTTDQSVVSCFNEAAGIPRGRPIVGDELVGDMGRFNEAAGIPRGRRIDRGCHAHHGRASMRPRVFPAEDRPPGQGRIPVQRASMRPRVFPAEDVRYLFAGIDTCLASMRPRVFPAEDDRRVIDGP